MVKGHKLDGGPNYKQREPMDLGIIDYLFIDGPNNAFGARRNGE